MPTKTTKGKPVASRAKPATQRKSRLARYIAVTGDLVAVMKEYQKLLQRIDAGKKIDVKAFERNLKAMNKAIDQFEAESDKHEEAVFDYVDAQTA